MKLLRVLQEGEYEPVGGNTQKADVRIVAATNRDLVAEVAAGRFREDLYYRLNVIAITAPPLRARREDIPLLVDHFLGLYCAKNGRPRLHPTRGALERLMDYAWPGNVRELENVIERAVVLSRSDGLGEGDLPDHIAAATPSAPTQLTFEIGTPLDEIELARHPRDAPSHEGRQVRGRAAARHLHAHHLPQARRGARGSDRTVDTLSLRGRPPAPGGAKLANSDGRSFRETSCQLRVFPSWHVTRTHLTAGQLAPTPMAIDKLLKRHFWAVILLLVAVAAFFDAQGIMHVVGASLGADAKQLAAPPLMARAASGAGLGQPARDERRRRSSHRNPFDSDHRPARRSSPAAEAAAVESAAPLDLSDPFHAPDCDGVRVLVIAASADPDWSFAALETAKEKGKSYAAPPRRRRWAARR